MKPVLFVTGNVPAYRVGALERLHEREGIELALFGGTSKHGGAEFAGELPFPHRTVRPSELQALAASSGYRAVVCPTGGRLAPLATWTGARRGRVPLILWASLWAHPRSAAHALTYLPLRRLYSSADAIVTYGPHVSAYVQARGAGNVHVAPQSVDNGFWSSREVAAPSIDGFPTDAAVRFLFVGRDAPEKGLDVLLDAWRGVRPASRSAALVLVGGGTVRHEDHQGAPAGPIVALDGLAPQQLRELYAACDILVVPSIPTRTFREPWGLVVNEAMDQELAVIASDAVGAAAGGLVRDGENGLIVPAGDPQVLAGAIERLARDDGLVQQLGRTGARDVAAYTHDAWAQGFSEALVSLGLSRGRW
ncbi:MAG TPA: glycosyltransferase family 4 protein [Solirubrobacteraceae bacterium]|nr:glycosyltransferase family 4 protein [Solirubrobacteraceae bacterium]